MPTGKLPALILQFEKNLYENIKSFTMHIDYSIKTRLVKSNPLFYPLLFGYVQGIFLALSDYKKLGAKRRRELAGTVLGFPAFLILYGITLLVGACSKPSWGKVARKVPPPQSQK